MCEDSTGVEVRLLRAGIIVWHKGSRYYARQGVHQASVPFIGDAVRSALVRAEARGRAVAALVKAKVVQQQAKRPPAPDSRPRRCHARANGYMMICRVCGIEWPALAPEFPPCEGDK